MTLQEVVKYGKPFKRKSWNNYYDKLGTMTIGGTTAAALIREGKGIDGMAKFIQDEDILADDWEVKEEWYEGSFKKKWPNGVLCYVWDTRREPLKAAIVTNYVEGDECPFKCEHSSGTYALKYRYAEPVPPEKAPAIISEG